MDTALLRTFLSLANSQSFTTTAKHLNVTQSTVSHQISRLEEHLGKQLFDRTTRSCRLTSEGMELVEYASGVVRAVDALEQSFKPSLISGTITVGVTDDYHLFVPVTRALKDFTESKPSLAIEIRAGLSFDLIRDLRERKVDMAIVREIPASSAGDALAVENLVWVTSKSWTFPKDGVIPLAVIAGTCAYKKAAITALEERNLPWKNLVTCTSLEGVLAVVEAGLAVSVITERDVREGVQAAPRIGLLPRLPQSSLSVRFSSPEPSVAARALARAVTEVLSEHIGSSSH